jgi:hypothetical protein
MPHQTSWYLEKRIILVKTQGAIDLQELAQIDSEIIQHIREGHQSELFVHIFVDALNMERMPGSIFEVNRTFKHLREPGLGWTIVIGSNPIARMVGTVVLQLTRMRFRMLPTWESALAFLAGQDSTLAGLTAKSGTAQRIP